MSCSQHQYLKGPPLGGPFLFASQIRICFAIFALTRATPKITRIKIAPHWQGKAATRTADSLLCRHNLVSTALAHVGFGHRHACVSKLLLRVADVVAVGLIGRRLGAQVSELEIVAFDAGSCAGILKAEPQGIFPERLAFLIDQ